LRVHSDEWAASWSATSLHLNILQCWLARGCSNRTQRNYPTKGNLLLCSTKYHNMEDVWGAGDVAPHIAFSSLAACQQLDPYGGRITAQEGTPGAYCIWDWLDTEAEGKRRHLPSMGLRTLLTWSSSLVLGWGETESTWYVGSYLSYWTSPWWWMMSVEQSVERVAEETEVRRENLPQCRFVHHKSHMTWLGLELGPPNELLHALVV
jgi:hypothetical protein